MLQPIHDNRHNKIRKAGDFSEKKHLVKHPGENSYARSQEHPKQPLKCTQKIFSTEPQARRTLFENWLMQIAWPRLTFVQDFGNYFVVCSMAYRNSTSKWTSASQFVPKPDDGFYFALNLHPRRFHFTSSPSDPKLKKKISCQKDYSFLTTFYVYHRFGQSFLGLLSLEC